MSAERRQKVPFTWQKSKLLNDPEASPLNNIAQSTSPGKRNKDTLMFAIQEIHSAKL
jgi:hypothetical protein